MNQPTEAQLRRGVLWDVFNGNEIQRVDFPDGVEMHEDGHNPFFDDDDEAFVYVCFAALAGNEYSRACREARDALSEIGFSFTYTTKGRD